MVTHYHAQIQDWLFTSRRDRKERINALEKAIEQILIPQGFVRKDTYYTKYAGQQEKEFFFQYVFPAGITPEYKGTHVLSLEKRYAHTFEESLAELTGYKADYKKAFRNMLGIMALYAGVGAVRHKTLEHAIGYGLVFGGLTALLFQVLLWSNKGYQKLSLREDIHRILCQTTGEHYSSKKRYHVAMIQEVLQAG